MKKITKLLFTTVAIFVTTISIAAPIDKNFRFNHNNITVRNLTVHFAPVLSSAAQDIMDSGNNLTFQLGQANFNPPYSGHVALWEGNWGHTGWSAFAQPYNASGQVCVNLVNGTDNNLCDGPGADYALVQFNTLNNPLFALPPTIPNLNYLLRHEMLHILGMGHDTVCTNANSVMARSPQDCFPFFTTLQPIDQSTINAWY